ncbi:MAG: preprotein translocase subunit YajC [Clostridiales bacterium]|nr:preprotein translocase subunit YajC [Clostridiales bacterium]
MLNNITALVSKETISLITGMAPLVIVVIIFYFFLIRPQKKKDKEEASMRKNLQVGDEVTTVGGVVGIVFQVKEDTVVIETGGDRSKIRIKKWAIAQNETIHENE